MRSGGTPFVSIYNKKRGVPLPSHYSFPNMSFTISQNLFTKDSTVITVVKCINDAVTMQHLQPLLDAPDCIIGVSATYDRECRLSSIAFSTLLRVLVVNIPTSKDAVKKKCVARSWRLIENHFLLNSKYQKYAFRMDQLAVALYLDSSVRINHAVDMLSVTTGNNRQSLQMLMNAMGGETHLLKKNVKSLFFDTPGSPTVDTVANVALQAWAACKAAALPHMSSRFASIPRIDTLAFRKAVWNLVNLFIAPFNTLQKPSVWMLWRGSSDARIVWMP